MLQAELDLPATAESALEDAVFALGGWQRAAAAIWPAEDPIRQGRALRNALDPHRKEKLSPGELQALIVAAARVGCLVPLARLCTLCGCKPPEPLDPVAEEGAAVHAVQQATDALNRAISTLERAQRLKDRGGVLHGVGGR